MTTSEFVRKGRLPQFPVIAAFGGLLCLLGSAAELVSTTDFQPVDLSRHYNRTTNVFPAGTAWTAVPWGKLTLDGIPYELSGVLELTGMGAAQDGFVFPGHGWSEEADFFRWE